MAKKILIVDDEVDILEVLQKRLKGNGYEVATAIDGARGLEKAKGERPDLIITDIVMPVMDGFAFYKELKNDPVTASIPVVVLSGRKKMEDSFRAMGVMHFIPKPFEADVLMQKIDQVLSGGVAQKASGPQATETTAAAVRTAIKKVLVGGSTKSVVEAMRKQLEKQGCAVEGMLDGPQVIVRAVELLPDLFVLDIDLRDMPTAEVIKTLRYLPVVKNRPIAIYSFRDVESNRDAMGAESAFSVDETVEACKQAGATVYIGPFKEFSFLKSLSVYL